MLDLLGWLLCCDLFCVYQVWLQVWFLLLPWGAFYTYELCLYLVPSCLEVLLSSLGADEDKCWRQVYYYEVVGRLVLCIEHICSDLLMKKFLGTNAVNYCLAS